MGYTPPYILVVNSAGYCTLYAPQTATTEDVIIRPNTIDAYPYLRLNGAGSVDVSLFDVLNVKVGVTTRLLFGYTNPDCILACGEANDNIWLQTSGTGKVRFGTHAATGDVACNGNIPFLDSAGNARKMMTTA